MTKRIVTVQIFSENDPQKLVMENVVTSHNTDYREERDKHVVIQHPDFVHPIGDHRFAAVINHLRLGIVLDSGEVNVAEYLATEAHAFHVVS